MEAVGRRVGRGGMGAVVLMAALQGGVWGMAWTPEHDREYVAAGRTGVETLPIATAENHFQVRDQVAVFATRDSLYVQTLVLGCTLLICGNTCFIRPVSTLATALPGPREAGPPVIGFARVGPVGQADRTASVAVARPGGRIHVLTFAVGGNLRETGRRDTLLTAFSGKAVKGFAPDVEFASDESHHGFHVLGTGGMVGYAGLDGDGAIRSASASIPIGPFTGRVLSGGILGTEDGRLVALRPASPPTPVAGPFGKPVVRLDERTALLADGSWLFNHGRGWSGPHRASGSVTGVLPVPATEGTVFRTYKDGIPTETRPLDHSGSILVPPSSIASPGLPRDPDGAYTFDGREAVFDVRLFDVDRNSPPPSFVLFGGDSFRPMDLGGKRLVRTVPGKGCEAPGLCLEGPSTDLSMRLRADSVLVTLAVMDNAGFNPMCPNPGFQGKRAFLEAGMAWHRNTEAWVLYGQDTLKVRFGDKPQPNSLGQAPALPGRSRSAPGRSAMARWLPPRGPAVDAVGRAGE